MSKVALTPPMGWNSWDCFGAAVTEAQVLENAKIIAEKLKPFGWEYVVVDIEWYQPTASSHDYEPFSELVMDGYGRLLPAENRFPSAAGGKGFAPLAKTLHEMGLKFGIHIMRGLPRMAAHRHLPIEGSSFTCAQAANPNDVCMWNPDMYGLKSNTQAAKDYYDSIFRLYASWGVDFVKCDDIAREYPKCTREIELISEARDACGRDMVLSLSPGPAPLEQAEHLKKYANMWRITDDFWDRWDLLEAMFERAEKWCIHSGPGHWPDADMLPIGALKQDYDVNIRTQFTQEEQRTMMTLWCMMSAPMMIGAHLPNSDEFTFSLLTNGDVLEILTKGYCAHPLKRDAEEALWLKPMTDGKGAYLAAFNLSGGEREISVQLADVYPGKVASVRELWTGNEETTGADDNKCLTVKLAPHDAAVWRIMTDA